MHHPSFLHDAANCGLGLFGVSATDSIPIQLMLAVGVSCTGIAAMLRLYYERLDRREERKDVRSEVHRVERREDQKAAVAAALATPPPSALTSGDDIRLS
jgi:hypothetical protein